MRLKLWQFTAIFSQLALPQHIFVYTEEKLFQVWLAQKSRYAFNSVNLVSDKLITQTEVYLVFFCPSKQKAQVLQPFAYRHYHTSLRIRNCSWLEAGGDGGLYRLWSLQFYRKQEVDIFNLTLFMECNDTYQYHSESQYIALDTDMYTRLERVHRFHYSNKDHWYRNSLK